MHCIFYIPYHIFWISLDLIYHTSHIVCYILCHISHVTCIHPRHLDLGPMSRMMHDHICLRHKVLVEPMVSKEDTHSKMFNSCPVLNSLSDFVEFWWLSNYHHHSYCWIQQANTNQKVLGLSNFVHLRTISIYIHNQSFCQDQASDPQGLIFSTTRFKQPAASLAVAIQIYRIKASTYNILRTLNGWTISTGPKAQLNHTRESGGSCYSMSMYTHFANGYDIHLDKNKKSRGVCFGLWNHIFQRMQSAYVAFFMPLEVEASTALRGPGWPERKGGAGKYCNMQWPQGDKPFIFFDIAIIPLGITGGL